jgi:NTE family protein
MIGRRSTAPQFLLLLLVAFMTAGFGGCSLFKPAPGALLETLAPPPPVPPVVVAPPAPPPRPLRIALALGGGAARGFAHIGVIKGLEARGIYPDIIVGTSAGSIVGALYAGGYNGIELNRLALDMDEAVLSDWAMPSRGLFKGESLQNYVNKALKNRPIEKLEHKFAATATDLHTGQLVVFEQGNTGQAVRASSSVPGVFEPVRIGAQEYVDGGLVSPVPVRVARRLGADIVIAVDISVRPGSADTSSMVSVLLQTFAIMGQTIAGFEEKEADIVIRPQLPSMAGSDFAARNSAVLAGEEAVSHEADRMRTIIEAKRRELNAP